METKRKIIVALVCTSMNQLGGKNVHLSNMYRHINNDRFHIYIVGCSKVENELKDFMLQANVQKNDLILISRFEKWLVIPFILRLRKIFIDKEVDIVHTFQIQSDVLGGLAARLAGIKHLISQYESKIIEDNISQAKQFFYKICNKIIKNWFKKTVVVSQGLKKELIVDNFRPLDKIEVFHIGIEIPERYKNCNWEFKNLREGRPCIGTIGRFSREKALSRFIAAIPLIINEFPLAQFKIVGKGDEKENLLNQVNRLGLSNKVVFNEIPWPEPVYNTLETIDIFVLPSVREGCPIALLEALSLARPVVASDIEGIKDVVENNKDGLLVDTTDSKLFAEKIVSLCKDPETAINFGKNGRQKLLNNFITEREMAKFKNMYLSL